MIITDKTGAKFLIGSLKVGTVIYDVIADDYGHIVKFTRNSSDELIFEVQFSRNKETRYIHPGNVKIC